jgi:hypothetical protein
MCDVYVYEDVSGGWTTHVASNRSAIPPVPEIPITWIPKLGATWDSEKRKFIYPSKCHRILKRTLMTIWNWSHRLHILSLNLIPRRTIGNQFDGETFNDTTPGECADTLVMLKKMGYRVPQYAINSLRKEGLE